MTAFVEWAAKIAPGWFKGPLASAWTESQAVLQDLLTDSAREAIKARFPDVSPEDALQYIASERGRERGSGELTATFRTRLREAWDVWVWAGTHKGVYDSLVLLGLPLATIRDYWDWPDAQPTRWARFWVILPMPQPWTNEGLWGDPGVYNDGGTWGSTITVADLLGIKRRIRRWKAAHAKLVHVIAIVSGELWGYPTGAWSAPGVWGGAEAIYWSDS